MFKGLHSVMVEAESQRGAGRRYAASIPRGVQLAGATLAAGIIFAAGYWCGSQSGSATTAERPAAVRPAPLTHEQMIHAMKQPDGPRPAVQRAVAAKPGTQQRPTTQQRPAAQQHSAARPVIANQGPPRPQTGQPATAAQRPAQASPRANMPHPMNMGRPIGNSQPGTGSRGAQPVRSAPPGSSLPQPGAGGYIPHAARAAAGGPATVGRPAPARTIPRSSLPQPN